MAYKLVRNTEFRTGLPHTSSVQFDRCLYDFAYHPPVDRKLTLSICGRPQAANPAARWTGVGKRATNRAA
jgi:hypothetical protein